AVSGAAGGLDVGKKRRDEDKDEVMPLPWRYERHISDGPACIEEACMSVNLIFKIAAVGILVSVLSQVLKHSGREEQAFLTSLAGLLLVLFWIVPYIYELFESIKKLFSL
ncbi:stage III sporulation protein AC, partial [[Clostridium] hylemonae DSM 15053]